MNEHHIETILYLAGNLFSIYVIHRFLCIFFKRRWCSKKLAGIAFFLYFTVNSTVFLAFQWPFLTLLSNLGFIFALTLLYDTKMIKRFLTTGMVSAVTLLCEDIVYRFMILFHTEHIMVIGIAVTNLLLLLIAVLLERLSALRDEPRIHLSQWIPTLLVPFISIFLSAVVLDKNEDSFALTIGTIGILAINILIFYLFDHTVDTYRKEYELALQMRQNEAYENQFRIQREADSQMEIFRHDMKNHLIALRSLAESKDNDELLSYVNEMGAFVQRPEQFVRSGNVVVDSILNVKLLQIREVGAEVFTEVNLPGQLLVSPLDLNIILGNLMDNAIRALEGCSVKKFTVSINYDRSVLYVKVTNTYDGNLRKSGRKLLTTKKERKGHGIGIQSVELAASKYNGDVTIDYSQKVFSVIVMLCVSE